MFQIAISWRELLQHLMLVWWHLISCCPKAQTTAIYCSWSNQGYLLGFFFLLLLLLMGQIWLAYQEGGSYMGEEGSCEWPVFFSIFWIKWGYCHFSPHTCELFIKNRFLPVSFPCCEFAETWIKTPPFHFYCLVPFFAVFDALCNLFLVFFLPSCSILAVCAMCLICLYVNWENEIRRVASLLLQLYAFKTCDKETGVVLV